MSELSDRLDRLDAIFDRIEGASPSNEGGTPPPPAPTGASGGEKGSPVPKLSEPEPVEDDDTFHDIFKKGPAGTYARAMDFINDTTGGIPR